MIDPTRSISDDIAETIAALDGLHAVGRVRRERWLGDLRNIVAGLDRPDLPDEPAAAIERPARDDERGRAAPGPDATVGPGPRQSAPFDFGPKVREKLRRIALEEGRW